MSETRDELLHETATVYTRAARLLDPVRLQVWESMGMTFPQLRILFRVRGQRGIDVRGLAEGLGISSSAASQQVDKLVARGLIRRGEAPDDRRHVFLELTELGEQAAGEISRASRALVEAALASLSDQDLAQLRRLLGLVVSAAGEGVSPAAV